MPNAEEGVDETGELLRFNGLGGQEQGEQQSGLHGDVV
jgi:hypothetical protein